MRPMRHTPFLSDLIQLQADWQRTYAALAVPRPVHTTALRRRLHSLSAQLLFHPYWSSSDRLPGARVELRRQARALVRVP